MRHLVPFVQCVVLLAVLAGCSEKQPTRKPADKPGAQKPDRPEPPDKQPPDKQPPDKQPPDKQPPPKLFGAKMATDKRLIIGSYAVSPKGVVDGDTIRVVGQRRALRLLGLDTEEIFHGKVPPATRRLYQSDFAAYQRKMARGRKLPVKYATPMGEEATTWARQFFRGVKKVVLESDTPGEAVGTYGRLLCYVWAVYEDGRPPVMYNLEAIRQGMSPYYNKYGRSLRFDAAFKAAQQEARQARRGIWNPAKKHYPDYPARLVWWNRRAEALHRFARLKNGANPPIDMASRSAIKTLSERVGQQVAIFGVVDDHSRKAVRVHKDGATIRVGGRRAIEVEIIGAALVEQLQPKSFHGLHLLVRGPLDRKGSVLRGTLRYMRIPVTRAEQVQLGHQIKAP